MKILELLSVAKETVETNTNDTLPIMFDRWDDQQPRLVIGKEDYTFLNNSHTIQHASRGGLDVLSRSLACVSH